MESHAWLDRCEPSSVAALGRVHCNGVDAGRRDAAGVSEPADSLDRAVSARRADRSPSARYRRSSRRRTCATCRRREQARRRNAGRRRIRREAAGRRLHVADGNQHDARHQPGAVSALADQSGARLRADLASRHREFLPDRESEVSGEKRPRDVRCNKGRGGQIQLRIGRERQPPSSVHGSAQDRIRAGHPARPVQGDAGGVDRSSDRQHPGHVLRRDHRNSEYPGRQGCRAGHFGRETDEPVAQRSADREHSTRIRLAGVAGRRCAGGNAQGSCREAIGGAPANPGKTGVQGTTVQIRHGPVSAADARAVRRHDRSRTAVLGEGEQAFRLEERTGNQREERA